MYEMDDMSDMLEDLNQSLQGLFAEKVLQEDRTSPRSKAIRQGQSILFLFLFLFLSLSLFLLLDP